MTKRLKKVSYIASLS